MIGLQSYLKSDLRLIYNFKLNLQLLYIHKKMLNQMMKKRDQKKQSIKLRAATDFEMEGMHNSFRTIVKHIGGLVNPDNTQVKLQQYLRSSV